MTSEVGTELATIERAMGDRHSDYFTGPRIEGETVMARRYRSLIETGTSGVGSIRDAAAARPEMGSEIAALERKLGDRRSDYWIGPTSTENQARYRELIAQRDDGSPERQPDTSAEAAAPCWATPTGQQILEEWSKSGGIAQNYEAARGIIAEVSVTMPPESRAELHSQIDGLPGGVQAAMIAELANSSIRVEPATPDHLQRFSATPEGAELVREWGRAARQRVAIVAARVQRLIDRLAPAEAASFTYFADHISGAEFKALATYLSK